MQGLGGLEAKKSDSNSVHGCFLWASRTGGMHEVFPTDSQFNAQPPEDDCASLTLTWHMQEDKQRNEKKIFSRVCALACMDSWRACPHGPTVILKEKSASLGCLGFHSELMLKPSGRASRHEDLWLGKHEIHSAHTHSHSHTLQLPW